MDLWLLYGFVLFVSYLTALLWRKWGSSSKAKDAAAGSEESNSHINSEIESLAKERDKNREILDKLMSQPFQWRELHGKLSERSEKLEEELMREKMKEDDCEEAIKDLQRTEASVMNAASQLVEQIREKKEGHQRKTQQLRSRIEALKGRRDLQQSDVLDAKKKRAEEVAALRAMDAMASKEEEEMRDILEQAVRFVEGGTWKEQDALQKFFKDAGETIKKMKY